MAAVVLATEEISRPYLGCISAVSRPYLGCASSWSGLCLYEVGRRRSRAYGSERRPAQPADRRLNLAGAEACRRCRAREEPRGRFREGSGKVSAREEPTVCIRRHEGGRAVFCSVFRAAREYEGGAKTVKAAGDGGIQLNTGPLERRWSTRIRVPLLGRGASQHSSSRRSAG